MLRRHIGNALRWLRGASDRAADIVDPAYAVELVARVTEQLARERTAYAAAQVIAPEVTPAPLQGPLECQTCMAVLAGAVAITGSPLHGHRDHMLAYVGYGPLIETVDGIRCLTHTDQREIQ